MPLTVMPVRGFQQREADGSEASEKGVGVLKGSLGFVLSAG